MSLNRILAVFYKDFMWASNNPKLLTIVLMPPLMSIFFQFAGKGALIGFSLMFSFSMIGCFLASYLIVEEKKIESLKNILITPLTASELCVGKFLFPLSLCLVFGALSLAIAHKVQLLLTPAVLLSLLLMGASVCLLGVFLGLIVKNEQELGVIAPIFILVFMGGAVSKKNPGIQSEGYFPEFHMVHLIENYPFLNSSQIALHLLALASLLLCIIVLTSSYVRFFFSSDLDARRLNLTTALSLAPLLIFMGVSGQTAKYFDFSNNVSSTNITLYTLERQGAKVHISYDNRTWEATPLQLGDASLIELTEPTENNTIRISLKDLKPEEKTLEQRKETLKKEGLHFLIDNQPLADLPQFTHSVYTTQLDYRTAYDLQCNDVLLKFSFTHPIIAASYKKINTKLLDILRQTKIECPPPKN